VVTYEMLAILVPWFGIVQAVDAPRVGSMRAIPAPAAARGFGFAATRSQVRARDPRSRPAIERLGGTATMLDRKKGGTRVQVELPVFREVT
jgi:hypothetical protein